MELRRLVSLSCLPPASHAPTAPAASSFLMSSVVDATHQDGVKIKRSTFGTDADGFRVVVLFLSNHTLLLHRSRGEGAQGHASESSGQFACRLLGWYSDAARVPQCLSLSANGKTLGVLTADGSVYVVPVHSLLARPVSRLYHAPVTPAGVPSMASLLLKRSPAAKRIQKDTRWSSVDVLKLPLPAYQGVAGTHAQTLETLSGSGSTAVPIPVSLCWVSMSGIALMFPSGVANVVDAVTCEVLWSGMSSEISPGHNSSWNSNASPLAGVSSAGSKTGSTTAALSLTATGTGTGAGTPTAGDPMRRMSAASSTGTADRFAAFDGHRDSFSSGALLAGLGTGSGSGTGGAGPDAGLPSSSSQLSPELVPSFVVCTDTCVYACAPSLHGPASDCLSACLEHLCPSTAPMPAPLSPAPAAAAASPWQGSARPRPDLALRVCAASLGVSVAQPHVHTNPYDTSASQARADAGAGAGAGACTCNSDVSVFDVVPDSQQSLLSDLLVQCYALCRGLFSWNISLFAPSAACGDSSDSGSNPLSTPTLRAKDLGQARNDALLRPKRASMGVVAGVDMHHFLLANRLYNPVRAVQWLCQLGCAFEALLVGHARGCVPAAIAQVLSHLGPAALTHACFEFLCTRGHVGALLSPPAAALTRTLSPSVLAQLVCAHARTPLAGDATTARAAHAHAPAHARARPSLLSPTHAHTRSPNSDGQPSQYEYLRLHALSLTAQLHLIDGPSLRVLVACLHPALPGGLLPALHTRQTAQLFVCACVRLCAGAGSVGGLGAAVVSAPIASLLLEGRSDVLFSTPSLAPRSRPSSSAAVAGAGAGAGAGVGAVSTLTSTALGAGGGGAGLGDTLDEDGVCASVRLLAGTFEPEALLAFSLRHHCFIIAACVCELERDFISALQCRLAQCVHAHSAAAPQNTAPAAASTIKLSAEREVQLRVMESAPAALTQSQPPAHSQTLEGLVLACVRVFTSVMQRVETLDPLGGVQATRTALVTEMIAFWGRFNLSVAPLAQALSTCLQLYGVCVAKAVLGVGDGSVGASDAVAAVLPPVLSLLSPQLRASVGAEVCFSAAAVDLPVALVCASVGVLTASPAGAGSGGEDPDTLRAHVVSQLLVKLDALAVESESPLFIPNSSSLLSSTSTHTHPLNPGAGTGLGAGAGAGAGSARANGGAGAGAGAGGGAGRGTTSRGEVGGVGASLAAVSQLLCTDALVPDTAVFSCGHSFHVDELTETVLPQYRKGVLRLFAHLPRAVSVCVGLFDPPSGADDVIAAPPSYAHGCPHCVLAALQRVCPAQPSPAPAPARGPARARDATRAAPVGALLGGGTPLHGPIRATSVSGYDSATPASPGGGGHSGSVGGGASSHIVSVRVEVGAGGSKVASIKPRSTLK